MIKSFGIPGQSQETRTSFDIGLPYILMNSDRPAPHYVATESGEWVEPPVPTEEILSWWKDLRTQRDKMLSTVVDIGMLSRMHGNDVLANECVGTDGLSGVAQLLRDLPGSPDFRSTFEAQPNRDAAELVARAWCVNLAASVSPELRNYFKEFV